MAAVDPAAFWTVAHDDSTSSLQSSLDPRGPLYDGEQGDSTAGLADAFTYGDHALDAAAPTLQGAIFKGKEHLTLDTMTAHASTPPIRIPAASHASHAAHEPNDYGAPLPAGRWHQPSPFEAALEKRRRSIAFNPRVALDGGHEKHLDEPLAKASKWNRASRPRGRSLMEELADPPSRTGSPTATATDWPRAHQGSSPAYDPFTDDLTIHRRRPSPAAVESSAPAAPPAMEHRGTLLVPSADELTAEGYGGHRERMASLTSTSTASPPPDEPHTPPPETPVELALAPLMTSSSGPHAAAAAASSSSASEAGGAWLGPAAELDRPRRTMSETFDASQPRRRSRRTTSLRSPRSPSSMSPASMFLSTWGKASAAAAAPEPDDAGQEVGDYVLGRQIGYGGFSVVREAHGIEHGERVRRAVKIVRKQLTGRSEPENEALQAEFEHEVSLWRCLRHRFILPLLVVYHTPLATFCFTELHPAGTLFDLVRANRRGIPAARARRHAAQLASALRYLHEDARIVHRDVKLENCLLDVSDPASAARGGDVLLCDFGMAEFMPTDADGDGDGADHGRPHPYGREPDRPPPRQLGPAETSSDLTGSVVGSLEYASPELLASPAGLISPTVDVWAFGVVLYALLVGDLPFRHTFLPRVQMMILKGEWDEGALRAAPAIEDCANDAIELLRGCFEMDPRARWTIGRVLGSALLRDEAGAACAVEDGGPRPSVKGAW